MPSKGTTLRAEMMRTHDLMVKAIFRPVNDDHAIERVSFGLGFERPFTADDVSAVREKHSLWARHLPMMADPRALTFAFDPIEKELKAERAPGLEFSVVRPDGTPVWSFRVVGPDVTVDCTRYSRWAKVWDTAKQHLTTMLELNSGWGSPNPLRRLTLAVNDGFRSRAKGYDASALLNECDVLPKSIFLRGPNWHAHAGWFDDLAGEKLLHNINLDSTAEPSNEDGDSDVAVTIFHLMTVFRDEHSEMDEHAWMADTMEKLHQANKNMVASLIKPAIAERIELKVN
ncbi:TIGR04255 family protein [soil metagenome]